MESKPKNEKCSGSLQPETCEDLTAKLEDTIRKLAATLHDTPGLLDAPDMDNLIVQFFNNIVDCHENIRLSMLDPSTFKTIGQIEEIMQQTISHSQDIHFKMLLSRFKKIDCEYELIIQKKTSTEPKESS
jgi:hypothetical protein